MNQVIQAASSPKRIIDVKSLSGVYPKINLDADNRVVIIDIMEKHIELVRKEFDLINDATTPIKNRDYSDKTTTTSVTGTSISLLALIINSYPPCYQATVVQMSRLMTLNFANLASLRTIFHRLKKKTTIIVAMKTSIPIESIYSLPRL